MNGPETEIGGSADAFPSTLWTVVLKAQDPGSTGRREALGKLIETYWKPAYFFIRRKGYSSEASKDLTQAFFAALLEKNYLQYVDRGRGRFRTFLFLSLEHFLSDERDKARAQKRGSGRTPLSLDFQNAEAEVARQLPATIPPDLAFRRDWAIQVMSDSIQALMARAEAAGKREEFDLLKPHLTRDSVPTTSYPEIARLLDVSEAEVRKRVHRMRAAYREAILETIRTYTGSEEEVREELADLFSAFS